MKDSELSLFEIYCWLDLLCRADGNLGALTKGEDWSRELALKESRKKDMVWMD
jgi:hypothetical protein